MLSSGFWVGECLIEQKGGESRALDSSIRVHQATATHNEATDRQSMSMRLNGSAAAGLWDHSSNDEPYCHGATADRPRTLLEQAKPEGDSPSRCYPTESYFGRNFRFHCASHVCLLDLLCATAFELIRQPTGKQTLNGDDKKWWRARHWLANATTTVAPFGKSRRVNTSPHLAPWQTDPCFPTSNTSRGWSSILFAKNSNIQNNLNSVGTKIKKDWNCYVQFCNGMPPRLRRSYNSSTNNQFRVKQPPCKWAGEWWYARTEPYSNLWYRTVEGKDRLYPFCKGRLVREGIDSGPVCPTTVGKKQEC